MEVGTNCNSVLVAKGIQLLLDDGNPFQSYCHFSSAIESTKSEEEKCKMIQFRDAAAAALVRMELESGDNYAKLGRFGSALEAYSSIRDKSTVPLMIHFQMLNNAGVCLARLGRKEESLAMQLKAFALNPHSSKTLKNIAILLADLGKFEEAISAFDAYLNKHPESYSALCGKAGCLKDLLMYAESITVAEQAQHIDPKLLRGRCAYDLKEHCRLELSRLRNIKNDSITISAPTVALASYFPNVSVNADNPDFNFDIWFNSVSSNISNKNLYDDFNIPNNRCCEASQALLREEELTASSPVIRYTERTLADFSRVPGNDMILSSTPIKQDACMTSDRVCYESTPLPDGVDESKVVYSKVFINEAKHVDSQGLVTREQRITANILNCPMQQMAATSSESRALGVIPYSRNNSTLVNNRNLRIKSVSSLENQKDQDHSILPSNNQPSPPGGWLKSPVAASAMSHEASYENSQGKKRLEMSPRRRTSAHLEIEVMTAPAARHRPLLFQSLPPERNICTPLISSLLTSDTNTSSHTVEDHTQTHLSSDTLTVDRHEASRSTSHVSSTHSDKSGRCRVLGSEDTCRAASQESHRPRRYDTALCNADAMTGIPELKVLDSIQVSSGKPRRRSATSREGNITVTDSRKGANSKVIPPSDALFIPPHRRDGDKCLTPSVSLDLPSPNMSATYAKPTLMIPYNKLRLLSSSVDSSISSIDTCRKENNLYEEEFEQIFEMTREQWNALPSWQQARKKKLVGLF